jgi:Type II secretion system (T2SS), protein G
MKGFSLAVFSLVVVLSVFVAGVLSGDLGARDARRAIAAALGFDDASQIRIRSINTGMGGQAVVEATVETAFRLEQDKDGSWKAVDVRTGDRRWESMELLHTAIRKEKELRTRADLGALAAALESYRREHGTYVTAQTGGELINKLAPDYLKSIVRLDAWSNEFDYSGGGAGYRLASRGPDGRRDTQDDIVMESGRPPQGAGR